MTRTTDLSVDTWVRFLHAHSQLVRMMDTELEAEHGMPLVHYDVLVHLAQAPDRRMRMCELADSVVLSRSGVTRLVDRLVDVGLVEKVTCPTDRRGVLAQLTETGLERLREASKTHLRGVQEHFSSRFSKAELRQFADLLGKLRDTTR